LGCHEVSGSDIAKIHKQKAKQRTVCGGQ